MQNISALKRLPFAKLKFQTGHYFVKMCKFILNVERLLLFQVSDTSLASSFRERYTPISIWLIVVEKIYFKSRCLFLIDKQISFEWVPLWAHFYDSSCDSALQLNSVVWVVRIEKYQNQVKWRRKVYDFCALFWRVKISDHL